MKKIIIPATLLLLAFACSPKTTKSTAGTPKTIESSATSGPTEAQLIAAKTKYPDVNMDKLKQGHNLYYGTCSSCHATQPINKWDETQWAGILDNMAQKAQLTPTEKDAVWKYVMAVKLAAK